MSALRVAVRFGAFLWAMGRRAGKQWAGGGRAGDALVTRRVTDPNQSCPHPILPTAKSTCSPPTSLLPVTSTAASSVH